MKRATSKDGGSKDGGSKDPPLRTSGLLQGTLDMLILRTLEYGSAHGHDISKHIRHTTNHVLTVEHGSLYPALHRLERRRLITGKWELHKQRNREFKYYRLTPAGRRHLAAEESRWKTLAGAIALVMWPTATEEE